jgi:hypothetical protein
VWLIGCEEVCVVEENRDEVSPAAVAAEFYFTACRENVTRADLQVL